MEQLFTDLYQIFTTSGWVLALIALLGIVLLGILKYCDVFKKVDKKYRHYIYLAISVGLSIIAAIVYLACVYMLNIANFCAIASAIFGLNQAAYAIYANTPLKSLLLKLVGVIKGGVKKTDKIDDEKKAVADFVLDKVEDTIEEKMKDETETKEEPKE